MNVTITKDMADAVGLAALEDFGADDHTFRWSGSTMEVDLFDWPKAKIEKLVADITSKAKSARGSRAFLSGCKQYLRALDIEPGSAPRNAREFEIALRSLLFDVPGHRVYKRNDDRDTYDCFYVSETEYHKEQTVGRGEDRYVIPAYVTMKLIHREFSSYHTNVTSFGGGRWGHNSRDEMRMHPREVLARHGYLIETDELRAEYLAKFKRWDEVVNDIGRQFLGVGIASERDADDDDNRRAWWYNDRRVKLDKDGEPAKLVIDVFSESETRDSDDDGGDNKVSFNRDFWLTRPGDGKLRDDDEDDETDDDGMTPVEKPTKTEAKPTPLPATPIEIPVRPSLVVFDLRRQKRLEVDIGQLTEYKYDKSLGDKLILPDDSKLIIDLLLSNKSGFKDIVGNKGGGAIILCAGPPGCGKTLSAEVYAEVAGRPLFSVQASQLGTDPDTLEGELLKTFARAARWKAILLIDEADVYVATRGQSLVQNAIVGVFLRTLEYYRGVMFLTTNRADLIDDAIGSRCVARIDYAAPGPKILDRVWRVLANASGTPISGETITKVVERYPDLTGRDVKNLLKLARLATTEFGGEVTVEVIDFVKRFKPTKDVAPSRKKG